MKKIYLLMLLPIALIFMFILGYKTDEMKTYTELHKIDTAITAEVTNPDYHLANTVSSLQQSFEELVEIGITFTADQDINKNFDQLNLALNKSNQLAQKLTQLFEIKSITKLSEVKHQIPDNLKNVIEQENMRIKQLKNLLNTLKQVNTQLADINTVFYNKKNNEVFKYITTVRESFNQIHEDYTQYSELVNEYTKQKSNLYSQITS
ncbi:MAG: hypothetical protein UHI85_05940 [Turicibacter sp.]|nr:hypothetical protein [Turicibacter sp.]MEE1237603.1 hypothetical protein [Turicibacter sp.]